MRIDRTGDIDHFVLEISGVKPPGALINKSCSPGIPEIRRNGYRLDYCQFIGHLFFWLLMGLQKLGSAIKTMLGWAVLIAIAPVLILICLVAAIVSREYREKLLSEVSPK